MPCSWFRQGGVQEATRAAEKLCQASYATPLGRPEMPPFWRQEKMAATDAALKTQAVVK